MSSIYNGPIKNLLKKTKHFTIPTTDGSFNLLFGLLLLIDLLLLLAGPVALEVERAEQVQEDRCVGAFHHTDGLAPAAVRIERRVQRVSEHTDELEHLQLRQVLFPPEVLLVLRTHRRQGIVAVPGDSSAKKGKKKNRA